MIGLYDWYPNWGTKTEPELGPPQRLYVTDGHPLRGPWRQQAGVGDFSGSGLPDIVIQDRDLDLALFRRVGTDQPSLLHPGVKLRYEDGETIKTHGVYTEGGGDGRGRTKITVVDWDGDGVLDLLLGVGPQYKSPYRGSYVLFAKNVGSNQEPVFKRPEVVLWDEDGNPLEFLAARRPSRPGRLGRRRQIRARRRSRPGPRLVLETRLLRRKRHR